MGERKRPEMVESRASGMCVSGIKQSPHTKQRIRYLPVGPAPTRASAELAVSRPSKMRIVVVLPDPFRPRNPVTRPALQRSSGRQAHACRQTASRGCGTQSSQLHILLDHHVTLPRASVEHQILPPIRCVIAIMVTSIRDFAVPRHPHHQGGTHHGQHEQPRLPQRPDGG